MTIDHDGLRIYICTAELLMEVDFNVILLNSSQYQINKVGNKKRDRRGLILFSPIQTKRLHCAGVHGRVVPEVCEVLPQQH